MRQKIFLGILIFVFLVFGVETFGEFMKNHTYYIDMFNSWDNWKIMIGVFVSAAIPTLYLVYKKKFSLKKLMIYLGLSLLVFTFVHTNIKGEILGGGFIVLMVNTLLMFFLGGYFMVGTLSLGTRLSDKFLKFKENRIQEMFINFGLGLGSLLLFLYILISFGILFGIVSWLVFLLLGFMIYVEKKRLKEYKDIISGIFEMFSIKNLKSNWIQRAFLILIGFSIIYYLYGFELSFIPYSTAWDANHAYMYEPKVLADNAGVIRGNVGIASAAPQLWHVFITFWFSLFGSLKTRLAPETFAVAMNFLSGILVLFFGLALIREIIEYFSEKIKDLDLSENVKNISFVSGRTMLLLWLSSGMGAFLVFVDNKTDLGVMAMTTLAILSGVIFIRYIAEHKNKEDNKDSMKYLVISGIFFALASMSKQTAFLDISIFLIFLLGVWMNVLTSIGAGISMIGLMGILQPGNAKDFLGPVLGKYILMIGLIIFIVGLIKFFLGKKVDKVRFVKNIVIWGISIIVTLLVFKGPALLYKQYIDGEMSVSKWAKGLILSKANNTNGKLLLATNNTGSFSEQSLVDKAILVNKNVDLSFNDCLKTNFSDDELNTGLREVVAGNEDVGRYVGYGRKEFVKPTGGIKLGYPILKLIWGGNGKCYSPYKDAKILCDNNVAIEMFNVSALESVLSMMDVKSKGYEFLSGALNDPKFSGNGGYVSPSDARDHILKLKKYYQDNTIKSEVGKISVPYRYIVPFNIVFNRSLQNLSSYYTDIGFIWMLVLAALFIGFIYSLVRGEKKLISIVGASLLGWIIWWIIGGGILWYGMGLIVWTILSIAIVIQRLFLDSEKDNDKILFYVMMTIIGAWVILQFSFNRIRIASQGAGGPFAWYKSNVGKIVEFDELLQQKEVIKYNYNWKDVFDLQFGHYNRFMDATKDRKNEDGVLIAGTYLPYFLENQKNIRGDGMLDWFWHETSDNNSCKSYKRLKDEKLRYLVIDPNIATVVMGEGNESLFNRLFAKRDTVTGKIKDHGSISMLAKMYEEGFVKLYYTNNLGAKYAFSLTDDELKSQYPDESDLIYLRAKLSVARFFPDSNQLVNLIATVFTERIASGQGIGDVADVFGKTVDEAKVMDAASMLLQNPSSYEQIEAIKQKTVNFTQDERFVLAQYLGLYRALSAGDQQYQSFLQNIISQSLAGGSQLIIFELK